MITFQGVTDQGCLEGAGGEATCQPQPKEEPGAGDSRL
jgi:hypothetical protein